MFLDPVCTETGLSRCPCRRATILQDLHVLELCCGSEAGWYLRLVDFVYHSTLGVRVIKKKMSLPPSKHPLGPLCS